ncbi:MAG TPA: hypothetical protein VK509_05445, partial [Polyangiales bacterium]|nr:hypothetical protein [Polyangiales bacterium]
MRMRSKWLRASTLLAVALGGCGASTDKDNNSVPGTNAPAITAPVAGPPGTMVPPAAGTAGGGAAPDMPTPNMPTPNMPAPTGTAGSAAMPVGPTMPNPMEMMNPDSPDGRGKCGIDSGFPGDEACLLPPAPGEGFQIHVGPKDYKNATDVNVFVFEPNRESSECWSFHTPNTEDAYWQTYEMSGRAGTHHIINTM